MNIIKFLLPLFLFSLSVAADFKNLKLEYPVQEGECKIVYPSTNYKNVDVRLKDIDLKTGIFTYYLYNNEKPFKTVTWINKSCKNKYSSLDTEEIKKVEEEFKNINFVDEEKVESELGDSIENLKAKYLNDKYKDTTTTKYLNTSKYLVAILTLDSDIINIPQSILLNKIILKDNYTLSDNVLSKKLDVNFFTLVFNFAIKADYLLKKLQFILLAFFLPIAAGWISMSFLLKKVQNLYFKEDLGEKSAVAILIFCAFMLNTYKAKVEDNKYYTKSYFQQEAAFWAQRSVDFADSLSFTLTDAFTDQLSKKVGISSKREVKKVLKETKLLEKELQSYKKIQELCYSNLASQNFFVGLDNFAPDGVTAFPFSENLKKGGLQLDESKFFKEYNQKSTNIKYTLSFCREVDIRSNALEQQINRNNHFILLTKQNVDNNTIIAYGKIVEKLLKNNAEYGFMYTPFILFSQIFIENLGLLPPLETNTQQQNTSLLNPKEVAYTIPWAAAPGAETTKKIYEDFMPLNFTKNLGSKALSAIPIVGESLNKMANYAIDKSSYIASIAILKSVYKYLPLLAIAIASILVISYYLITLFVYIIIAPFYAVYIFTAEQEEQVTSFMKRGIVVILKPVLIVISLIIATIAVELISVFGYSFSEEIFDFFDSLNLQGVSTYSTLILAFLHGLTDLILAISASVFAFYFVFKGVDVILAIFGFEDRGIDAHQTVSEIEQKIAHKGGV